MPDSPTPETSSQAEKPSGAPAPPLLAGTRSLLLWLGYFGAGALIILGIIAVLYVSVLIQPILVSIVVLRVIYVIVRNRLLER